MLGHSHATSGALLWAATAPTLPPMLAGTHLRPQDVLVGTLLCAGAALLPDLDHRDSTIAHFLGPLSRVLCRGVARISGGHRQATHSFVFVVLAGVVTWAGEIHLGRPFTLAVVFVLIALAVRALHLCPPGQGIQAWGTIVVVAAVGTALAGSRLDAAPLWLPFVVALGALAHLAGDCLTPQGCPLLWPLRTRYEFVLIRRTGNRIETFVIVPLMTLATGAVLWFTLVAPASAVHG
jgi:membrane-bound metal-dependent hydrolase YbcI (DUF457 family)